ncbi:MAG: hypothetical protein GXX96_31180 [Planctomycetaceae bacterium]|nr:hypothetical protein [Planctomycetaceae bacterium]
MLLGRPATETERAVMRNLPSLLIPQIPTAEEPPAEKEADAEAGSPTDDEKDRADGH